MNKKFILLFIILLVLPMSFISAKRMAPKPIDQILFGIKYSANHSGEKMGYLYAYGVKTGIKQFEKKIYSVSYKPFLETDVQDVYISELNAEGDKLIVTNEKGDRYEVDPNTGEVLNNKKVSTWLMLGGALLLAVVALVFLIYKFFFRK